MKYNFDEVIVRGGNHAAKWEERGRKFGRDDVIPLWVADMDFRAAQPVIDALEAKARYGVFGYTHRPARYFDAVCRWQLRRNNWAIDQTLASFSPGVIPALSAIIHQFTQADDRLLIQTPVYQEFEDSVTAWNRRLVVSPLLETGGHYTVDFANFETALAQKPAFFILCSPHNPVGRVWKQEELARMAGLCLRYGVRIISDEIHSDLVLWGGTHIPTATLSAEVAANTITLISGTKTFNLAGLQAATVVFPNKADKILFEQFWRNLDMTRNSCFSVVAMEAAFLHGEEWLGQLLRYLEGNINFIHDYCAKNIPAIKPNKPEATYLVWLDCRALGLSDTALARFMVEAGLGMNSGASYGSGGEGYMRLNAACPRTTLEEALEKLMKKVNER
jgi:cystathionine beta-lyase